jgi:hypothetical protein
MTYFEMVNNLAREEPLIRGAINQVLILIFKLKEVKEVQEGVWFS